MQNTKKFLILASCFLILASQASAAYFPDDPYFKNQWGLYNNGQNVGAKDGVMLKAWNEGADISAPDAWEILYNKTPDNYIQTESDPVVIAIIDTGVDYNHEDLKDMILRDSSGKIIGYDFVDNDSDPMDENGHGTMVASIMAASGNNSIGMAGVVWDAKIMPIRILDQNGHSETSKISQAIKYAADNGADIINMSIVSDAFDPAITQDVEYAYNKGAVLAAAAGNAGSNLSNFPVSPINNDNLKNMVIGVGALNSADQRYELSNFGDGVDISAPGTNIVAAVLNSKNYSLVSGTSAAAAYVSGAAALVKKANPDWKNSKIISALLENSSSFFNNLTGMGSGRLNAKDALEVKILKNNEVIKIKNSSTVYVTISEPGDIAQSAAPISSADVFLSLGYNWSDMKEVSEAALNRYSKKLPITSSWIPAAGIIIRKPSDQTLYLVEKNSIRGFTNWHSFISRGYILDDVKIVPSILIDAYKKGENIE